MSDQPLLWLIPMALYLLTKGIATGTMLVSLLPPLVHSDRSPLTTVVGPAISLLFLAITAAVLVADLERPERFYYILIRPNWRSWMVWGAYFLTAQGAITTLWLAAVWFHSASALRWLFRIGMHCDRPLLRHLACSTTFSSGFDGVPAVICT